MQPTFKHVPPSVPRDSTHTVCARGSGREAGDRRREAAAGVARGTARGRGAAAPQRARTHLEAELPRLDRRDVAAGAAANDDDVVLAACEIRGARDEGGREGVESEEARTSQ